MRKVMKHMSDIKKTVDTAYSAGEDDFEWKPIYPNNMVGNGLEGYYAILRDYDGKPLRKFSIVFQHPMDKTGLIDSNLIDRYILFVKILEPDFKDYCEPYKPDEPLPPLSKMDLGVNDYGSFIYACETMEKAKKLALTQYKMIFGYCMSHLIPPDNH